MKILIQAIDKAVRAGVYTLDETSVILKEIEAVGRIIESAGHGPQEPPKETKGVKK